MPSGERRVSAFVRTLLTVSYEGSKRQGLRLYLANHRSRLQNAINNYRQEKSAPVRFRILLSVSFYRIVNEKRESRIGFFGSKFCSYFLGESDLATKLEEMYETIIDRIDTFVRFGSQWRYESVNKLELKIGKYIPFRGGSFIPTPAWLSAKSAVTNIQSRDSKCVIWAVLASLHADKVRRNPNKLFNYLHLEDTISVQGLTFPLGLNDMPKLEKQNQQLAINVFGLEGRSIITLYLSPKPSEIPRANLLLLSNKEETKFHFVAIRRVERLLRRPTDGSKFFYCLRCLCRFKFQKLLSEHEAICSKFPVQTIVYGKPPKNLMEFNNHHKSLSPVFSVFADFETLNIPVNKTGSAKSTYVTELELVSYSYVKVDNRTGTFYAPVSYAGPDAIISFLDAMIAEEELFLAESNKYKDPDLSFEHALDFAFSTKCGICGGDFKRGEVKVRDHDHSVEKLNYRCAAHKSCNLAKK